MKQSRWLSGIGAAFALITAGGAILLLLEERGIIPEDSTLYALLIGAAPAGILCMLAAYCAEARLRRRMDAARAEKTVQRIDMGLLFAVLAVLILCRAWINLL